MAEKLKMLEPGAYIRRAGKDSTRHVLFSVITTVDGTRWWRYAGEATMYLLAPGEYLDAERVGLPGVPEGTEFLGKPLTMSEIEKYLSLNPELKSQLHIAIGALGKICTATTSAFKDLPHSGAKEMVAKLTALLN